MKFRSKMVAALLVSGSLVSFGARAECPAPAAPASIPDARVASEQEMIASMHGLWEYNERVETYLRCLDSETEQNRLGVGEQVKLHNGAVDVLQRLANRFNEQVRTFKARAGWRAVSSD